MENLQVLVCPHHWMWSWYPENLDDTVLRICFCRFIFMSRASLWIRFNGSWWVNCNEELFICLKIWCMPSVYWSSKGKILWYRLVVKQLLPFIHLSIFVVVVYSTNLSLALEVTCISVFPGFLMSFPMIHVQELLMTLTVAYIDSSSI